MPERSPTIGSGGGPAAKVRLRNRSIGIPRKAIEKNSGCMSLTIRALLFTSVAWIIIVFYYWYSVNYVDIRDNSGAAADQSVTSTDTDATATATTRKYLRDMTSNLLPLSGSDSSVTATTATNTSITQDHAPQRKKIAYAITVTKDGPFIDGALVLGYGVMKLHGGAAGTVYSNTIHTPPVSQYDAELVAFVTPEIVVASRILRQYGWRIITKPLPVSLDEIQNKDYVDKMRASGCCGADEFLKLWAYTLTDYHRVVHLDMDSCVFQSMDELYSLDKELLFTGDYNMKGNSPVPPVQGGFLVVRPSFETFRRFQEVIRKGDYSGGKGWGGSHIGNFWGGQTIQGIMPYYYYSLAPGEAQEVNRCVYNCMVDNPYVAKSDPPKCLDGQSTCQDCRLQEAQYVKSAHFTICQKPWTCTSHDNPKNKVLCSALHQQWFELRGEFERDVLKIDAATTYTAGGRAQYGGMCRGWGSQNYVKIPLPDSQQ